MAEKNLQEVKAVLRFLRQSPRKVRLVCDVIRGMELSRAQAELLHIPKRASGPILKLLNSAVANARNNFHLKGDTLFVKQIIVNQGPTLKRYMPRAHGRATPIRKRSCHVTLVLGVREEKQDSGKSKIQKSKQPSRIKNQES